MFLVLIRDLNEFSDSKLRVGSGKSFHAFTVEGRKYSEERLVRQFILTILFICLVYGCVGYLQFLELIQLNIVVLTIIVSSLLITEISPGF